VSDPGDPAGPYEPHEAGEPGEAEEGTEDMIAGFRRTSGGVSARFTPAQASIVRSLVGQIAELIGGEDAADGPDIQAGAAAVGEAQDPFGPDEMAAILGQDSPAELPDDPVLARLFPDAYREDPGAAGDFRRYTEPGLRDGKVAAARTVLATLPGKGGRVRLSQVDGEVWLRALNDVRLALGIRLGITEDYEHEMRSVSADDPRAAYLQVYDWLTFLQETLVRALW
jgi:uncharacterized protein DUF2017